MVTVMRTSLAHSRCISFLLALSTVASAQTVVPEVISPPGGSAPADLSMGAGMLSALDGGAGASASMGQPPWTIQPRIMLTETLTDNVRVNGSNDRQADQITEIAPGIRIQASSARLKGHFDYSLRQQFYAQHPEYDRTQNSLNSFATLEAVEQWLFVDFSGVVAQQPISAFGAQSPGNTSINSNVTETSTYRLSPYIRGQIAGVLGYSLRHDASTTRSASATATNLDLSQWSGQLSGGTPFQRLSWSIDGSQSSSEYGNRMQYDADRVRATASYLLFPDLRFSLNRGREANNYASANQESRGTHGFGFEWNPTERTTISASKERRFFGDGHNFSFSHRFPLSSISYTDTKDVSLLPNQFSQLGQNANREWVEQYCRLLNQATPENIPNCVIDLLSTGQGSRDFLSAYARLQRRQQLAVAIMGARNSLTLVAHRSESQSLQANDFLDETTPSSLIEQKGLSLSLSHQLSPITNLNFLASRQESIGNGDTSATNTLYQLGLTSKLGSRTSGSLTARQSSFESQNAPRKEHAVIGTISFIY